MDVIWRTVVTPADSLAVNGSHSSFAMKALRHGHRAFKSTMRLEDRAPELGYT